jgi:hypothetical protein
VRVIFCTSRTVDIKGIDNHHVNDIGIGAVGGIVNTQKSPVVAIIQHYALLGKGASIHSPSQLKSYKSYVNDKSVHVHVVINSLLLWMATSFLLSLKMAWHVSTFGLIRIMSMNTFLMSSSPPKLSGITLS